MKHRGQDYYEFAKVLYRDDDTPGYRIADMVGTEEEVELKYVGSGSGTYFNTSMEYALNGMLYFSQSALEKSSSRLALSPRIL